MHPRAADHWGDGGRGLKHSVLFILMGGFKEAQVIEASRTGSWRHVALMLRCVSGGWYLLGLWLSVPACWVSAADWRPRFVAGGRVITGLGARWPGSWTDFDAEQRSHCCRCPVTSCCGICSVRMQFDASGLRRAGGQDVPWRARGVTLIWIRTDGRVAQAQGIEEKRQVLRTAAPDDLLLLAWPGQYRQDIFLVDDRDGAVTALEPPSRRAQSDGAV